MAPSIKDFKVYMPAKDFELSKGFYTALGFTLTKGFGDTVDCELDGFRFRLQNYYVKVWSENFMVVMPVDDVEEWHQHVRAVLDGGAFPGARVMPPEQVEEWSVLHVHDPSGVLLVFVQ